MSEFTNLPEDMQTALDNYDADVESGAVTPWNPDDWTPTEHDEWLTEFLGQHLPGWGANIVPSWYRHLSGQSAPLPPANYRGA